MIRAALFGLLLAGQASAASVQTLGVGFAGAISSPYTVSVDPLSPGFSIPQNFVGISFETSALVQTPAMASNTNLIAILSVLGTNGIVRFGGNTSDSVTPLTSRIQSGANFVKALGSGWSMIYGLSCTQNNPTTSASQAATVSAIMGPAVTYQIGNEPNVYGTGPCVGFSNYQTVWQSIHDAVVAAVPGATFMGADIDVSANVPDTWSAQFATALGSQANAITIHTYSGGASSSASVSVLNAWNNTVMPAEVASLPLNPAVVAAGLPARMTETGTVSNSFGRTLGASLYNLWEMITMVKNSWLSANFHEADAVTSFPGYAPVVKNGDGTYTAQSSLYAMVLFNYVAGCQIIPTTTTLPSYIPYLSVKCQDGSVRILLVNKTLYNFSGVKVALPRGFSTAWSLIYTAPSFDATSGFTIGNSGIASNGAFSPSYVSVPVNSGNATVAVPASSALLVQLQ